MTTIYFIRHSETLKSNNIKNSDSLQVQNEKWPLTETGENIAREKSQIYELQNKLLIQKSHHNEEEN